MTAQGLPIGTVGISRIVHDAKYTFRKAKRVLTSSSHFGSGREFRGPGGRG
jgi:hypothetical protein